MFVVVMLLGLMMEMVIVERCGGLPTRRITVAPWSAERIPSVRQGWMMLLLSLQVGRRRTRWRGLCCKKERKDGQFFDQGCEGDFLLQDKLQNKKRHGLKTR